MKLFFYMIKNFRQFNEELSPELLKRAANTAYDRDQRVRGDKFYRAAVHSETEARNSKKRENYNEFMRITGGMLLGGECVVDDTRVNPGGDTWIELKGDFRTKKGSPTRLFITDDLIRQDKILCAGGREAAIDIKDLVVERKDARVYANFLNWWKGEQKPFSVDDYCIKGIHVN